MKFLHNLYKYNDGTIEVAAVLVGKTGGEVSVTDGGRTEHGKYPPSIHLGGNPNKYEWFTTPKIAIENEIKKVDEIHSKNEEALVKLNEFLQIMAEV